METYEFIKDYTCSLGTITSGDGELTVINDVIYYNGGLLAPDMQSFFKNLIKKENENPEYLKKLKMVYNKL